MTEQAFLDAVRRDQAMLYRVAYTLLHNGEDCNDALQDAVVNAWRWLHTLRDDAAFRPWMTRIIVNCAKDMLRKRRLETVELPETLAAPAVEDTALSDALARLKESLRLPLVLFYMEGLSIAEIAQAMRLPQGTVKNRLARGRKKLAELLEKEEKTEWN